MIDRAYPQHPDKGYAMDLACPVILCDACGRVIDKDHPGNVLWHHGRDYDQRFVHKGACDRAVDPNRDALSAEVSEWVEQLAYNYANPILNGDITLPMTGLTVTATKLISVHGDRVLAERGGK